MTPAIYLDRDGVLIKDTHLLTRHEDVEVLKGAPQALTRLCEMGFKLIVVTNQTVVSRGLLSLDETVQLNQKILADIETHAGRKLFSGTYISPFHPNATISKYRLDSECRKPRPGMLLKAKSEHDINLKKSYMIGDRTTDIVAGNLAGCKTIHLLTGEHEATAIESSLKYNPELTQPSFKARDWESALDWIENG